MCISRPLAATSRRALPSLPSDAPLAKVSCATAALTSRRRLGTFAQRRARPTTTTPTAPAAYSVGSATSDGQRFRILRPHAQGGLGAVFVALDSELNREVALKQILDHHADDPVEPPAVLDRGRDHRRAGAPRHRPGLRPGHLRRRPAVLRDAVHQGGQPQGGDQAVPRRCDPNERPGRPLARAPQAAPHGSPTSATPSTTPTAAASCTGTSSPANIIVGKYGETLVVDWGLAKPLGRVEPGQESGERTLVPSSASGSAETLPGSALGTPAYMSPEQARGELDRLGSRSDVYSLGATLYCLLTGRPPFEGEDIGEVLGKVQRGDFVPPRSLDPAIDPALEAVCLKAMALKPEDRYATCRALADDVERWMADEPVTAWREPLSRRARRWARRNRTAVTSLAAAVLVALAGTAAVLAVQTQANGRLKQANIDLAVANRLVTKANADLKSANAREKQRFDLAMEAIKLFHGEVGDDLVLKADQFKPLRDKLLRGALDFYGKLEGLLKGSARPGLARRDGECVLRARRADVEDRRQAGGAGGPPQGAGGPSGAGLGAGRRRRGPRRRGQEPVRGRDSC